MKVTQLSLLLLVLCGGGALIVVLAVQRQDRYATPTLAPAFQLGGKVTQGLDRALGKIIPADEMDESELGKRLAATSRHEGDQALSSYLNSLANSLSRFAKKPFDYKVFAFNASDPNAYALPGGVIFVSTGLLNTLRSESELFAVIAHEMGHIELGHCFNAVKFELAAQKISSATLGRLLDFTRHLLLRHSFSKTEENEADDYAFAMLLASNYDPMGLGMSFERLRNYHGDSNPQSIIGEYFASHPTLKLRAAKTIANAEIWWKQNGTQRRYVGQTNLEERQSMSIKEYPSEWVSAKSNGIRNYD